MESDIRKFPKLQYQYLIETYIFLLIETMEQHKKTEHFVGRLFIQKGLKIQPLKGFKCYRGTVFCSN